METFAYVLLLAVMVLIVKELFFSTLSDFGKRIGFQNGSAAKDDTKKYFTVDATEEDFFGDKLERNDPTKFHAMVAEKRKRLDEGKIIGVNAAEAFYLIRNQRQQNLLVSEDGIMHWKDLQSADLGYQDLDELSERIMTVEVEGSYSSKLLSDGVDPVDENIEHIESMASGMFKIVYKKEHAAMTGVDAVFIDQYGRICGGPNSETEIPKRKTAHKTSVGIADKKIKEMEERAEVLLGLHRAKEKAIEAAPEAAAEIEEIVRPIKEEYSLSEITVETEARDEAEELEEELGVPNFSFGCVEEVEADPEETVTELGEAGATDDASKNDCVTSFSPLKYRSFEHFRDLLGEEQNGEAAFHALFEKCSPGRVVVDREEKILYLEKNFVGEQIKSIILDQFKGAYDDDLIASGTSYVYDREKLNSLIGAIHGASEKLEAYGRGGTRKFFKMLFRSEEVEDLCFLGWYLKIRFDNCADVEGFLANARGATVTVVASDLKTIIERHERLKAITKEFV